ncbi:MAG: cellulose biosynthesis cyclic di-GMP-binding regulatory protein BcsB [Succinivibrionaceae bacterium]|nr:cellulose biosynthesis cyclic di-GMP-binding regulatory protein BcsB [Succinivibrionaceae bacterium]
MSMKGLIAAALLLCSAAALSAAPGDEPDVLRNLLDPTVEVPGYQPQNLPDEYLLPPLNPGQGAQAAVPGAAPATPGTAAAPAPGAIPDPGTDSAATGPQGIADPAAAPGTAVAVTGDEELNTFSTTLTLAQLGARGGLVIKAGQSGTGIDFQLPMDKLIISGKLALNIEVSKAMAKRGSHLDIALNSQPIGTLPLSNSQGPTVYELDLPFEYFATDNTLSLNIADDEELACMIDYTNEYRLDILPDSYLRIEGHLLPIETDLSIFPMPFIDPLDVRKREVALVFPRPLRPDVLPAAAIISSFLGIRADYRGVKFSVHYGELPQHAHAIVFGRPGEVIGGVTMPDGPSVTAVQHPLSPVHNLILISAQDQNELRGCAYALANHELKEKTNSMKVGAQKITERTAYDAPKWIPTDRKVWLSELLRPDQTLESHGLWHSPLNISFRAAPDLYQLYGQPIDLHINYSFPLEQWLDEGRSWLNVVLSGNYIDNLPVNKIGVLETLWRLSGGDGRQESKDLPIQPYMIYGDNTLSLYFDLKMKDGTPCSLLHENNFKSTIGDTSYIDLSETDHYARLPNLSFFVGASFPFTKYADLGQTILLLPDDPTPAEVGVMMDMIARAGNATGVTANFCTAMIGISENSRQLLAGHDIFTVSTLKHREYMGELTQGTAFAMDDKDLTIKDFAPWKFEGGFFNSLGRLLTGDWRPENLDAGRFVRASTFWRGFISFISPWDGNRIVVTATANDDSQLSKLSDDLDNEAVNRNIGGDLSVISGADSVRSFTVGDTIYSGNVSTLFKALHFAGTHVFWLAVIAFSIIFLVGIIISGILKRHAHRRLEGNQMTGH